MTVLLSIVVRALALVTVSVIIVGCADSNIELSTQCGNGIVEPGEACDGNCPTSCDDTIACTQDLLAGNSEGCTASCVHTAITVCVSSDGCCTPSCDVGTDSDCSARSVCGDGVVEGDETCDGNCPETCDDGDPCTVDVLEGSSDRCDVACTHDPTVQCSSDDGCCPSSCSAQNDGDCTSLCGNGVVEPGETCDGNCPSCVDGNPCTQDILLGSAGECDVICRYSLITECAGGDQCCPAQCDAGGDNDCSELCGNGELDPGETCDPPQECPGTCDDMDTCTRDGHTGSADNCNLLCTHEPVADCVEGDGCCPAGCTAYSPDGDCGECLPQESRSCGISEGVCRTGFERCLQDGYWSGVCDNQIEPSAEICDGLDQDCNGVVDNGTFLPAHYDAIEWLEPGVLGLESAGILMTWGDYAALWDYGTEAISIVFRLDDLWAATAGQMPPSSNLDGIFTVPAGMFGSLTSSLCVVSGSTVYMLDETWTWSQASIAEMLGFDSVSAVTSLRMSDYPGLTSDMVIIVSGAQVYLYTSEGLSSPMSISSFFCPNQSVNCPSGVDSLARIPAPNLGVLVGHDGSTYYSPLLEDEAGNGYFSWNIVSTGSIPCEH